MSGTESVVYKNVAQGSQLFGESFAVLGFFCSVTGILKKDNVSVLHSFYCCFCIRSNHFGICCKFYFLAKQLGKTCCNRCQRQLRLGFSLRLSKMGAKDNLSSVCDQLFDSRKRCNQTVFICDFAFLQRYVEVASAKDAFSFYVDIINGFLIQ